MKYVKTETFRAMITTEKEHIAGLFDEKNDAFWLLLSIKLKYKNVNEMINEAYTVVEERIRKRKMDKLINEKLKNIAHIKSKFVASNLGWYGSNVNVSEYVLSKPRCVNKMSAGNIFDRVIDVYVNVWEAWRHSNYITILLTIKSLEFLKEKGYKTRLYVVDCASDIWGYTKNSGEKRLGNVNLYLKMMKDYHQDKVMKSFFLNTRTKGVNDNIYLLNTGTYIKRILTREYNCEFYYCNSYGADGEKTFSDIIKSLKMNNGKEFVLIEDDTVKLVNIDKHTKKTN